MAFRRSPGTALGAVLTTACLLPSMTISSAAAADIPAAGAVTTLYEHAAAVLTCGGHKYDLDLDGVGQFLTGDPRTSHGGTVTPLITTEEDLVGYSPAFGKFAAHESAPATGSLNAPAHGSGVIAETLAMNLTLTLGHNPCRPATRSAGPVTARTLEPVKLVADTTSFPPPPQGSNPDGSPTGGVLYSLQSPIKIGLPGGQPSDPGFMQLQGMNINVGQVLG
ncbi:hypothetical protein ABH926_003296 [Catenulispora sp. GP43]|uniref:hypothetical protein n=1 Tax=Catenulispora sp. GP43 TaxID=3156263 RepID=UPI0035178212